MSKAGSFFRHKGVKDAFRVLAWVPVGIFFTRHVYSLASVTGGSMQPTFNPNLSSSPLHHDVVLLERWSVAINRFRRGDVVTLWSPQNPELLTTKRIVALEGDLVNPLPPSPPTPIRIPPGHCWVEGDSKYQTRDSNTYGPIPLGLITSRVAYILWPWPRRGLVDTDLPTKSKGRVRTLGQSFLQSKFGEALNND
ncbi:mitochondrial inner membrane protease subunit 2 [Kwoniella mangroviensis CBS 10435]|uniref:Mitochondrial inner membrane protease subunit 2 n=1 Tax=Kwoniella mangroviensis CBS 10435 TaxID=1331196 RepID=A0A1B9IJI5_9TREE|nr:mitochondrial inner membrane protease subunit 2 [Kwoniella mangroviensis CBS 8507]OCF55806.1 mitochondrial inner membrane protease subunit 2 [Kwoniella mangroviensis CBS 10435]OCF65580.1 mitochondrial inner membrane protease subunit 2 [Kwoniella mangroviensis CBS 8507]OCF71698.1 mitochondrial inner membrane protease subunit 2 [Kwoniella mangroviensis CBS 8886]